MKPTNDDTELDELIRDLTRVPPMAKSEARQRVKAWAAKQAEEVAKAYGGCTKCYGKGYHTKIVSTLSKLGHNTKNTIGYCTCARGKQLAELRGDT